MSYLKNELSKKNPYWISKDRRLELVHFCLQYNARAKMIKLAGSYQSDVSLHKFSESYGGYSSLEERAIFIADLQRANKMIEDAAKAADETIAIYILESATIGTAFPSLRAKYDIPCGSDYFYDRYRKFFWILSCEKGV